MSTISELDKIIVLLKKGSITREEFELLKAGILNALNKNINADLQKKGEATQTPVIELNSETNNFNRKGKSEIQVKNINILPVIIAIIVIATGTYYGIKSQSSNYNSSKTLNSLESNNAQRNKGMEAANDFCNCYQYTEQNRLEEFTRCKQNMTEKWNNKLNDDELKQFYKEIELCTARWVDTQQQKSEEELKQLQREINEQQEKMRRQLNKFNNGY